MDIELSDIRHFLLVIYKKNLLSLLRLEPIATWHWGLPGMKV